MAEEAVDAEAQALEEVCICVTFPVLCPLSRVS